MGSLGQELKDARDKKGLTLREISDRTRISCTFLDALEKDDYAVIPGDVFVAGFMRSYAREVGLDEKYVLARYREIRGPSETQVQESRPAAVVTIKVGDPAKATGRPYLKPLAALVVVLIMIALSVIFATRENHTTGPVTVGPAKPLPAAAPAFRPATTASTKTAYTNITSRPARPLMLRLSSNGPAWYSYQADNDARNRGMLDKGMTVEVAAEKKILLDLGNAGETKVEFNGAPLKPFGRKGVPQKNILFTKDRPGVVLSPSLKNRTGVSR